MNANERQSEGEKADFLAPGSSGILFHDTLLTLSAKTFTGLRKQQLS